MSVKIHERARKTSSARMSACDGADSLASFLMMLARDSGPVGDQVRTFIVGDALAETVELLKKHIGTPVHSVVLPAPTFLRAGDEGES
jgi:hypothetical protein